jgi:ATP-dependent DNA ligase
MIYSRVTRSTLAFENELCSGAENGLHRVFPANRRVRYTRQINDASAQIWQWAVQMELEGIVAKDGSSSYTAGRMSRWQKIKTDIGAEREKARRPER